MNSSDYVFADEDARQRLDALSALFDPVTFRHVEALGIDRRWRCWEVGAGGPTVANWLGHRVGATGTYSPRTSTPARSPTTSMPPSRCDDMT